MPLRVSNSGGSFKMPQMEVVTEYFYEMPTTANWKSITYGNGKFVAVANSSDISAYSTDGINWTQTTLPVSAKWADITYGNGKFIAIDSAKNSGVFSYSSDGITWYMNTTIISSRGTYISHIVYGNSKFVAVGVGVENLAACSNNGIDWETNLIPTRACYDITYGNNMFVVVAEGNAVVTEDGGVLSIILYSVDGINWESYTLPIHNYTYQHIKYGNDMFVAISGNTSCLSYSSEGIQSWHKYSLPINRDWSAFTYGNGMFIAVASNNDMIYSTDGITWNQSTMPLSSNWSDICYDNGVFIAIANNSNQVAYSTDGISWITAITETTYQPLFTKREDDDPDKDWEYHGNKIMTQDYTDIRDITTGESCLEQLQRITGEVL